MLDAYIAFQARAQPHAAALITPNRWSSYAQLDADVNRFAAALRALGVTPERGVVAVAVADSHLMRLSDAIAELQGIEGAQVHRSWWVARTAIVEAVRGDGRATLTLKDGAEVPVSRTYARLLRQSGWI